MVLPTLETEFRVEAQERRDGHEGLGGEAVHHVDHQAVRFAWARAARCDDAMRPGTPGSW